MFITVKYGNNESLLCNPACVVVNLLSSIKRRAGFNHSSTNLDLSDETGLVKELDQHQYDSALKHLTSHGVYILVEKHLASSAAGSGTDDTGTETDGSSSPSVPLYTYTPLLDRCNELFPNFKVHEHHLQVEEKRTSRKQKTQSPSPAGLRTKGRPGRGNLSTRTPSRRK